MQVVRTSVKGVEVGDRIRELLKPWAREQPAVGLIRSRPSRPNNGLVACGMTVGSRSEAEPSPWTPKRWIGRWGCTPRGAADRRRYNW